MVKSGKPCLTTSRLKLWLVKPGLHPVKPWFSQAFGARVTRHKIWIVRGESANSDIVIAVSVKPTAHQPAACVEYQLVSSVVIRL